MQILWYDYETSGRDPAADRVIQMGWQLTDPAMEPLSDPDAQLVRLPDDVLPSPGALLVHQIAPEVHQRDGITEAELAVKLDQLIAPKTLVGGYNSRRFDDRFTQHIFYRCLFDPYRWQFSDGRGRFDLYPVVLVFYVMAPEAIHWPEDADGRPRFKLDRIGPLNQLDVGIQRAHDAGSDVMMTARLARTLALHYPDLFADCLRMIDKHHVTDVIRGSGRTEGLLEVTAFGGWESGYTRDLWIPFRVSERSNDYVAFDLNHDPESVLAGLQELTEKPLEATELSRALRALGVHTIRTNSQPMLFRRDLLDAEVTRRLSEFGRDVDQQNSHRDLWHHIQESPAFKQLYQLVISLIAPSDEPTADDVDLMLYGGAFLSDHDKALLADCPRLDAEKLKSYTPAFEDARYPELVFRYRARNFPGSLNPGEWRRWQQRRRFKLIDGERGVTSAGIHAELNEISAREDLMPHHIELLSEYVQWLDAQPPI